MSSHGLRPLTLEPKSRRPGPTPPPNGPLDASREEIGCLAPAEFGEQIERAVRGAKGAEKPLSIGGRDLGWPLGRAQLLLDGCKVHPDPLALDLSVRGELEHV